MIVIIGTNKQYQVESIVEKLRQKRHDVILVDFLKNSRISVCQTGDLMSAECEYQQLENTKLVYHDPKYLIQQFGDTEEWLDKYVTQTGWKDANFSIFALLNGVKLNPLQTIFRSFAKLEQLKEAHAVGLKIPPFILSNNKSHLIQFCREFKEVITKSLGSAAIPVISPEGVGQQVLMTSPVSLSMIEQSEDVQPFPILLQKNLKKKYEYRIVVAGNRIEAFRIDPNQHPIMQQDYRRGGYMVQYERVDFDVGQRNLIMQLHNKLGLFSGSYDFIETQEGEFFFLEVNPAGVWAYIDQISGGVISDMFADEIARIYSEIA